MRFLLRTPNRDRTVQRLRWILLVATALFVASLSGYGAELANIPDKAARDAAAKRIADIFKSDYQAAQTSQQRIDLAQKMVITADATSSDSAAQHELYRVARDIYAKEGQVEEAWKVVDASAKHFRVDRVRLKASALAVAQGAATTSSAKQSLSPWFEALIHEAVAEDRFDLAVPLAKMAVKSARGTRNPGLLREAESRAGDVTKKQAAFADIDAALKKLETNPEDAEANMAVGSYRAFSQRRWTVALPRLAKGTDTAIRKAAEIELEAPKSVAEQVKLGDLWWEIAETADETERLGIQQHAAAWYVRALPKVTGLDKIRLEKRLKRLPELASGPDEIAAVASKSYEDPAIKLAVKWIISRQLADGGWNFNHNAGHTQLCPDPGSAEQARNAATAMALLPMLLAGQTHTEGDYRKQVEAGLVFLGKNMKVAGNAGSWHETQGTMYSHALATTAVAEAYARTRDRKLQKPLQLAVNFIVASQDPVGGGWRYNPRQAGDTSVLGWQMAALTTAKRAGAEVPDAVFAGVVKFLDSLQADGGSQYGYTSPASGRTATTAIGLHSRLQLGWAHDHAAIRRGVASIERRGPSKTDVYSNYYATKLLRELGGEADKRWQERLYTQITDEQETEGAAAGTWYSRGGHVNDRAGRLGMTFFAVMMLHMRHDPAEMD